MVKTTLWGYLNPKKVKIKIYPMVKTSLRCLQMRYLVVYQDIFRIDLRFSLNVHSLSTWVHRNVLRLFM